MNFVSVYHPSFAFISEQLKFSVDKKIEAGIMGDKFKGTKAMKRRVHSERSYRESPVAAKEKMRKEWKMVLEPRTERITFRLRRERP